MKRYKSLFDNVLYKMLPTKDGNSNWSIQIRSEGQPGSFWVQLNDGYRTRVLKHAFGWDNLKKTIAYLEEKHEL